MSPLMMSVFPQVWEDARIGTHKISWKDLTIWRPVLPVFPRALCLILDLHPELLSGPLKVSSCSGHDIIAVDVDGKCQSSVGRALFCLQTWPRLWGGHFMTILSYGAENVHSQVWQRFGQPASKRAVTGLGHKTVSKILWTTCLIASWSRKTFPLVASSHI